MSKAKPEAKTDRGRNIQHDANGKVVTKPWNNIRPAAMMYDPKTGRRKQGRRFARGRYWKGGKIVGNIRYKEIGLDGVPVGKMKWRANGRKRV